MTAAAAARHTPRLEARFGASTASVVDLALPTKTRAGYHVIAEFSREQYDARLAFAIAAAPELLEALSDDSTIAKFIAKRGEGVHHIAFEVKNIRAEMARLKGEGFVLLNDEPKMGADNKLVCFVHPKGVNGVLVELCQENV